ncbi:hypothetical protein ACFPFV_04950 [Salinicoccus siamensis]|uniref:hypothetical protein n=1 Tax=Salinicoccus siamensis TaxID=381830 RepID=UPI00361C6845
MRKVACLRKEFHDGAQRIMSVEQVSSIWLCRTVWQSDYRFVPFQGRFLTGNDSASNT